MPGKKKRITKSQCIGWYDGLEEKIQKVANERFDGNVNAAVNFLAACGIEAEKSKAWGNGQIDRTAFAEAAHA